MSISKNPVMTNGGIKMTRISKKDSQYFDIETVLEREKELDENIQAYDEWRDKK